ncbi:hypothetical protein L6164_004781 [Bauhinia variegata]|uniref:Uncharacterized protein n=1 Tax=Bauhinia variegata TaxID=167791 RepID=A0ACB9PPE8_BAUVA|nr:hypothetical protein L6164_004781 [Bauhinia variegata]
MNKFTHLPFIRLNSRSLSPPLIDAAKPPLSFSLYPRLSHLIACKSPSPITTAIGGKVKEGYSRLGRTRFYSVAGLCTFNEGLSRTTIGERRGGPKTSESLSTVYLSDSFCSVLYDTA